MSYSVFCIGPDDVPRLRDEHSFLVRQLDEIIELRKMGQRSAYEVAWTIFVRDLGEHMLYEENLLFPAFSSSGENPSDWAVRFRAEHADFRRRCCSFGTPDLHQPAALEWLHLLAASLAEHQANEGRVLYPWLVTLTPNGPSWDTLSPVAVSRGSRQAREENRSSGDAPTGTAGAHQAEQRERG